MDGWYLATSPEHYRTHKCHIKATRSDQCSDTIQFQHKRITNPTITPHDKVMREIADCAKVIKGVRYADVDQYMRDMQQLAGTLGDTQQHGNDTTTEQTAPRVQPIPRVQPAPRVDTHDVSPDRRTTTTRKQHRYRANSSEDTTNSEGAASSEGGHTRRATRQAHNKVNDHGSATSTSSEGATNNGATAHRAKNMHKTQETTGVYTT